MSKKVIWIPRRLSDATLERARRDYEVIVNEADTPGTAEDIIAMSAKVDGMIPCHSEHFSADVVARLDPRLKIVANHSVGDDHARCAVGCHRRDRHAADAGRGAPRGAG